MKGFFIVFEGGEGCGKSTQRKMLANRLREAGYEVVTTREPGGTEVGAEIRKILLSKELDPPTPRTEAMLYYADREQHIEKLITPALQAGKMVLSARFFYSTWAYQLAARTVDREFVMALHRLVVHRLPDLVILLDIDPRIGLGRKAKQQELDRFELEKLHFHERVNQAYRDLADEDPTRFLVMDATQPPHLIGQEVWRHVAPLIKEALGEQA